jgi:predicted tellurium resistance membrane protein TerC
VWCSTLIIKWIERFPFIIYIGAGVLAFTAGKMITGEAWFHDYFTYNPFIKWSVIGFISFGVILAGVLKNQKNRTVKI